MGAVRKSVWGVGGVAAAAALLWWLWPAPRSVDVATVTQGPLQVTVDDVGETRSHDRFVVSAPIARGPTDIVAPIHANHADILEQ